MQTAELIEAWKREQELPFSGWDFSHLDGRMLEERIPWSYPSRAAKLLRQASSAMDMGTGGGERFLELREYWPTKVVATEEYPPNVRLATRRLSPLGVQVREVRLTGHDPLPFGDGEFDLVLNRHSAFNAGEVARVLAAGGTFLTQQVHGLWAQDLLAAFDASPQWPDSTPGKYVAQLEAAGLKIANLQEWSGRFSFTDVGAVVYFLKAVPWAVPDFSVDTYSKQLLALQRRLENGEGLAFTDRKYLVEAHKG